MHIKGDGDLADLTRYENVTKSKVFSVKNFGRNYLRVVRSLPVTEPVLYAMPALSSMGPMPETSGVLCLTEKRVVYCGGHAVASLFSGETIIERLYSQISGIMVSQLEGHGQFVMTLARSNDFNVWSSKQADSFYFYDAWAADLIIFANNAAILAKRNEAGPSNLSN